MYINHHDGNLFCISYVIIKILRKGIQYIYFILIKIISLNVGSNTSQDNNNDIVVINVSVCLVYT